MRGELDSGTDSVGPTETREPAIDEFGEPIKIYGSVTHRSKKHRLSFRELLGLLSSGAPELCARFESAEGGHYVKEVGGNEFRAVYAGPHGPENRPAKIDKENLERLFWNSERIELLESEDTPFSSVATRSVSLENS